MGYELLGRLHAALVTLRDERGQGTIEYVGLVLLLAVVLGAVVGVASKTQGIDGIPKAIVDKLKQTIGNMKVKG